MSKEYPNDKETQDWMNAPLGKPISTPEEQVKFWSDKYDAKVDELHEMWQKANSFEGSFNSATETIKKLEEEIEFLKESRSKWAKQSSENADLAERNSAEGVERFCKKHGLIRCECPEEMGLSLAELKALEKVADASEKLFSKRDRKQISDRDFDGNLRHRKGSSSVDFLNHWLKLCRPHAYATQDDSWGELEKLLAIILRNYVNLKVFVKPQIKSALDALKQLRGGKNEWRKK